MRRTEILTLISLIALIGCQGDKQLVAPILEANITLDVRFQTPPSSAQQTAVALQVIDRVTVSVINSSNVAVIENQPLEIVETVEGRFAEGNLSVPVAPPHETFAIDVKAFENDVLLFSGGTAVVLSPGQVDSTVQIFLRSLGTGDVQVTLTWNTATDQDLHVIDPSNTEIFFGNPTSPTGGQLDFDDQDGFGPENIFWPLGIAPQGRYRVQVVYFAGSGATQVTVIVKRSNVPSETFRSTLQVPGDILNVTEFNFP